MAAVRPLVLVYQELASVNSVAATPTMESLIAGPCYHIMDYPANRASISISEYGVLGAACSPATGSSVGRPVAGSSAISLAEPPGSIIGAQLEHNSVSVYFENAYLEVISGIDGVFEPTAPDENLFRAPTNSFGVSGVRPGDRLTVTDDAGDTYILFVQEVGGVEASTLPANELRTSTNFAGDTSAPSKFRIERHIQSGVIPSSYVECNGNQIDIKGGAVALVDVASDGNLVALPINYAELFVEYRALRTDLARITSVDSTSLETVLGKVDERNPLAVGAFVALANTTSSIQVYGVDSDDLNGEVDSLSGYQRLVDLLDSRDDTYAITPLTQDMGIINAIHAHAEDVSGPERAKFRIVYANGTVLPETKVIAGSSISGTSEAVSGGPSSTVLVDATGSFSSDGVRAGDTLALLGTAPFLGAYPVRRAIANERLFVPDITIATAANGASPYYVLRGAGTPSRIVPAESDGLTSGIELAPANADASDVGKIARLVGTVNNDLSPLGNNDYLITAVDVTTGVYTVHGDVLAQDSFFVEIVPTVTAKTSPATLDLRTSFRQVLDNTASFIANGVVAGDVLQVPIPAQAAGVEFDVFYAARVSNVLSENRLELELGSDIPTTDLVQGQTGDLGYRVIRVLDKTGQKEELLRVVDPQTGPNSKRLVLVWPDVCTLTGVQNAKTQTRSRQPGYYLACALAGMSAGLPPHQGFTFLGISGIDEIFHSSRYFKERDLTEISNSGWYLFVQDTVTAAPYCVHQLTTDTSALENAELSIVRVFDYVSRFYKAVLNQFIGKYNVTPQTLEILAETLNNATDQLRSDFYPRIGAPLLGARITTLAPLVGQRDRVEVYMDVDLPAPLNRIGLHLVA